MEGREGLEVGGGHQICSVVASVEVGTHQGVVVVIAETVIVIISKFSSNCTD